VTKNSKITLKLGNKLKTIPIYSPDVKTNKGTSNYYKSCWYSLIRFKPWNSYCETLLNLPMDSCCDIEVFAMDVQNLILTEWESFMNDPNNLNEYNDAIKREIDRLQLDNEQNGEEYNGFYRSQEGQFSAADEQPAFNELYRNMTNYILDDETSEINWDQTHEFHINFHRYQNSKNSITYMKEKVKDYKVLRSPMQRNKIFLHDLKNQQKNAANAFLHLCGVMKDVNNNFIPSKRFEDSFIPNAMIITGTAGTGKSYTIDCMITELLSRLQEKGILNKEVLVMAPTGRAAMQAKGYTLHCSEGLSIPVIIGNKIKQI
jgi:AAA domain